MDLSLAEGRSQIALYGSGASSCGYCASSSKSGRVSYGVDCQLITPADYQALIDRGWRRSGTYIYLPDNKQCCCPNWTIRLRVPDFRPNKHHRKVKNKFDNYVRFGPKKQDSTPDLIPDSPESGEIAFTEMQSYLRCAIDEALKSSGEQPLSNYTVKLSHNNDFVCNLALVLASRQRKQQQTSAGPRPIAIELCTALQRFQLRDGEHSITISNDDNGFLHFSSDSFSRMKMPHQKWSKASPSKPATPTRPSVNFSARMVPAEFSKEAFDVYRLYQVAVHKDEIHRLTERQYRNFLCDSPITMQQTADPNIAYGSFHIEYRFDEKLIGVSVVDILPKCVSSVYFFYDPDYAFLSLGVWSALYELSLVPKSSILPDLRYYYLGYYVHSCPKMRYKKQFAPAELLCHEKFSWHPLEKCLAALDEHHYVAFSTVCDPSSPADEEPQGPASIDDIPFALGGQHFRFRDLKEVAKQRLSPMMQEFFEKFGPHLATRRFIITNIYMTS